MLNFESRRFTVGLAATGSDMEGIIALRVAPAAAAPPAAGGTAILDD